MINEDKLKNAKLINVIVYADRQSIFNASFNNNDLISVSLYIMLLEMQDFYKLKPENKENA